MASSFSPLATTSSNARNLPSTSRTPTKHPKYSASKAAKVKFDQPPMENVSGVVPEYIVRRFSDKFEERLYEGRVRRRFFCKLTTCRLLPDLPKSFSSKDRMVKHMQDAHGEGFVPELRKKRKVRVDNNPHVQAIIALQKHDATIEVDYVEGLWFCKGYITRSKERSIPSGLANQEVLSKTVKTLSNRKPAKSEVDGRVDLIDLCTPPGKTTTHDGMLISPNMATLGGQGGALKKEHEHQNDIAFEEENIPTMQDLPNITARQCHKRSHALVASPRRSSRLRGY